MHFEITTTVHSDRDQSCDTFTMTQTFVVHEADFNPARVRELAKKAHGDFRAAHPHNHTLPCFLPTDVVVREVHDA